MPVLKKLSTRDDISLSILAHKHAVSIFSAAGLSVVDSNDHGDEFSKWTSYAENWLEKFPLDCILTATSFAGFLERAFIRIAKKRVIYCITVLDFWTNYASRFLLPGEKDLSEEILPDAIAVIDDFAASEMQVLGFPKQILHITGQPAFDRFVLWTDSDEAREIRQKVRNILSLDDDTALVVFFSQYISDMYPPGTASYRGYTEYDVLSDLVVAITQIEPEPLFAVKTHPKETPGKYADLLLDASTKIQVVDELDADALVMGADILVGMTSTVLVKGLLAGRKLLSYQPNLVGRNELVFSRMGLLETITDRRVLASSLEDLLDSSLEANPDFTMPDRAVDHILALIDHPNLE